MAPAYQVIKMLKMNHLGLYTPHDLLHSMLQLLQSVIKEKYKGAMPVTEYIYSIEQKTSLRNFMSK